MPVPGNLDALLDPEFQNTPLTDLVTAPVSALAGIDEAEAAGLAEAFGIHTIGDLAENVFVRAAVAIRDLAVVSQLPPAT
jgi:hypothetical protein